LSTALGTKERSMTMDTDELIQLLVEDCGPVRPLPRPWIRTVEWLALSTPYVLLVVFVVSPRADLSVKISDLHFVVEQVAAMGTVVAASAAALATIIPGHSRKILALPFLLLSIWLASLGHAYVQDNVESWIRPDFNGLTPHPDWYCFPAIVLVGSVPALAMIIMLRRGVPLTLHLTAALGGLSAAALGSFGLRFFCSQDGSLMVLIWQFGTVCLLSVLAGYAGPHVLRSTAGAVRA
jgi:hypothetical protein